MIHEKDLATSRPEFFRNLAIALQGMAHEIDGDHITVGTGAETIAMHLTPLPPRVLSPLLKLERWKLTMQFNGHTDTSRDEFLAVFDQAFRRGGG